MGKNKPATIILCILIVLVIVLAVTSYKYASDFKNLSRTYSQEYLHMNSILPATFEEKISAKESFMALIGRPACGDCRAISDDVIKFVESNDLQDKIYYVNIESIRTSATDPEWVEFKEKYGEISGTPSFLFVEKGKVVSTLQWQENKPQLTVRDMNEWLDSNLAS